MLELKYQITRATTNWSQKAQRQAGHNSQN